jgi:hypothetical protein
MSKSYRLQIVRCGLPYYSPFNTRYHLGWPRRGVKSRVPNAARLSWHPRPVAYTQTPPMGGTSATMSVRGVPSNLMQETRPCMGLATGSSLGVSLRLSWVNLFFRGTRKKVVPQPLLGQISFCPVVLATKLDRYDGLKTRWDNLTSLHAIGFSDK